MPENRIKFYRYSLLAMLGVTRAVSRADYHLPSKWHSFFDSFKASSRILHNYLSRLDPDVEEEFHEKEKMLEMRFGKEKFYNEEEVEKLRNNYREIDI